MSVVLDAAVKAGKSGQATMQRLSQAPSQVKTQILIWCNRTLWEVRVSSCVLMHACMHALVHNMMFELSTEMPKMNI